MKNKKELLNSDDKLHTTALGVERIKKILSLHMVNVKDNIFAIDAYSFTVITAHQKKTVMRPLKRALALGMALTMTMLSAVVKANQTDQLSPGTRHVRLKTDRGVVMLDPAKVSTMNVYVGSLLAGGYAFDGSDISAVTINVDKVTVSASGRRTVTGHSTKSGEECSYRLPEDDHTYYKEGQILQVVYPAYNSPARHEGQIQDAIAVSIIDVPPKPYVNEYGCVLLPLRPMAMSFGAPIWPIIWEPSAHEVQLGRNGSIVVKIGSTVCTTDKGDTITLDTAPVIIDGKTYVSIDFFTNVLGVKLDVSDGDFNFSRR